MQQQGKPVIGITVDIDGDDLRVKHDYPEAVLKASGIPVLIPPVGNPFSYAKMIDGLIISGGGDIDPSYYRETLIAQLKLVTRRRSDFEIALLKEVMDQLRPVFGICYGMQLINVALGGSLYQDIGLQRPSEIDHTKGSHPVVIEKNNFFKEGEYIVNSTHHQAVKELGAGLTGFAFAPDMLLEAFSMKGYPFLVGLQWHPERLMDEGLSIHIFQSFIKATEKK